MSDNYKDLVNSPIDSPEIIDQLWLAYDKTKDKQFILKIISILDWEDRIRKQLETWFKEIDQEERIKYQVQLSNWMFPMNYNNLTIDEPVDIDLHVAILARNGHLKFNELPIQVPPENLVRAAMKSAATWSLLSMSEQDQYVALICSEESKIMGGAARMHLSKVKTNDNNLKEKNQSTNEDKQFSKKGKWWKFWD